MQLVNANHYDDVIIQREWIKDLNELNRIDEATAAKIALELILYGGTEQELYADDDPFIDAFTIGMKRKMDLRRGEEVLDGYFR